MKPLLFFAGVLAAIALLMWRAKTRKVDLPERPDEEMNAVALGAVQDAHESFGKTLDLSPESVKLIEEILATLHERQMRRELSNEEIKRYAIRWGAYIGEVVRKMHPDSHWHRDSETAGPKSYPIIEADGRESYPMAWCGKRILNGNEDNIWNKFYMIYVNKNGFQDISAGQKK